MQDRPTAGELLEALQEWIESVADQLPAAQRYEAKVAAHVCGMLRRELDQPPEALAGYLRQLGAAADQSPPESMDAGRQMLRRLASEIRAGGHDARLPQLVADLEPLVELQLAVARPKYRA